VTNFSKFLDETKSGIIQVTQDYSRLSIITQICAKKNVKKIHKGSDNMLEGYFSYYDYFYESDLRNYVTKTRIHNVLDFHSQHIKLIFKG